MSEHTSDGTECPRYPMISTARLLNFGMTAVGFLVSLVLTHSAHSGEIGISIVTRFVPLCLLIAIFGLLFPDRASRAAIFGFAMGGTFGPVLYYQLVLPEMLLSIAGMGESLLLTGFLVVYALTFTAAVESFSWRSSRDIQLQSVSSGVGNDGGQTDE